MSDRECIGRVAAYATHTSIAEFRWWVTKEPPYDVLDFAHYLEKHGGKVLLGPIDRELDGLVLVATEDAGWSHALFWDAARQTLLDCKADGIHPVVETNFTIKCWIPLSRSALPTIPTPCRTGSTSTPTESVSFSMRNEPTDLKGSHSP